MKTEKLEIVRGSGNAFRDLGRENAELTPWGSNRPPKKIEITRSQHYCSDRVI